MSQDLHEEDGFMLLELIVAVFVLSVALLALMAGYDSAFLSLHKAAQKSSAATLAQNQLELYSALSYSAIGLDTTALSGVKSSDSMYTSDEAGLDNAASATDHTIDGCGTSTQCLPVQTLTGSDHKSYRVETFVRDVTGIAYSLRPERVVTVIVRDPSTTGSPEVTRMSAAYDAGP
jgi:Tfp pilus assembly protein PilV